MRQELYFLRFAIQVRPAEKLRYAATIWVRGQWSRRFF